MTSRNSNSYARIWTLLPWLLGAIFLFALIAQSVFAGEKKEGRPTVSPREAVEEFCQADFDGGKDRYDVAQLTSAWKAARQKEGYAYDGKVGLWDWDPYAIVISYEILSVLVKGKRGTAIVAYRRVGRSDGKERIVPETTRREVVTLNLTFDGTRWWVVDPPLARVSKKELLFFYEKTMERFPGDWLERLDITEHQKAYFLRKQEAQRVLKTLTD
jgi:hypothetical protein